MSRMWVPFRGDEIEITYRDHGYEPDTNAHTIDWDFAEKVEDATDEECEAIDAYVRENASDQRFNDDGI